MEHDVCADLYPDCAGVVGWALCGATIGIARKITTFGDALVIHAVATAILSYVDQGRRKRSPRHLPLRKVKIDPSVGPYFPAGPRPAVNWY